MVTRRIRKRMRSSKLTRSMDCRVKPGNDEIETRSRGAAAREVSKRPTFHGVIARSQRVRPEVAGPMTGSATKQSRTLISELDCFASLRCARNDERTKE
jgi:hypothetical protein